METPSGDAAPKKHIRHPSSGRALPRRPTRGPLDINDAPITAAATNPPPSLPAQPSSLLSPTASQYATPGLPSPQPGSNLSTLSAPSFITARSSISPSPSPSRSTSALTQKDFSFLLRPELYHPLTLLDVPPPFRISSANISASTPLPSLISSGHFRSAAIKAASELTSSTLAPSDHSTIFSLLYTRLSCLTLCNQTALAAQEVKALEDLNASYYRDEDGNHLVPWEMRVLAVRLQGMGFNDARRGVMGFYELAREARSTLSSLKKQRRENATEDRDEVENEVLAAEIGLWEERLAELGIRVASALVEMDDLEGATRFLASLKPSSTSSSSLDIQKALLWLCIGDVEAARSCVSPSANKDNATDNSTNLILALAHMADSDFASAVTIWSFLISSSAGEGDKAMYKQNLGVCYLYLGRMDEARDVLETLVEEGNSFHALTFNLSTIYELCTERSRVLKIGLAERVAGLEGREGVNADFKL